MAPIRARGNRLPRAGLVARAQPLWAIQHGDRARCRRPAAQRVDFVVELTPCAVRRRLVGWTGIFSAARQPGVLRSSRRPRTDRRARAMAGRNADSRLQPDLRGLFRAVRAGRARAHADAHREPRRGCRQRHRLRLQSLSHGAPRAPRTAGRLLPAAGVACAASAPVDLTPAMAGGVLVHAGPAGVVQRLLPVLLHSARGPVDSLVSPKRAAVAPGGSTRRLGPGVRRAAARPAAGPARFIRKSGSAVASAR